MNGPFRWNFQWNLSVLILAHSLAVCRVQVTNIDSREPVQVVQVFHASNSSDCVQKEPLHFERHTFKMKQTPNEKTIMYNLGLEV